MLKKYLFVTVMVVSGIASPLSALAQNSAVPEVNLGAPTTGNTPFGAFRLVICDGPEGINHYNTATGQYDLTLDANKKFLYPRNPNFIPCNFRGLMIQIQFLINAMVVLGVFGAIIGFAYAGFLYITGTQKNLDKAHAIFPKVFWGFIIMLTAWFIVYQILKWLTGSASYLTGTAV